MTLHSSGIQRRAWVGHVAATLVLVSAACTPEENGEISGVGLLEVVDVNVATTSTARVARMLVNEGDLVHIGDTIAVLDLPTLPADLAQARADEARAAATLAELAAGPRDEEIERAEAELAVRDAELHRRIDDSTRIAPLVQQNAVAVADLVAARAAVLAAAAEREAAAAELTLLREGTRAEQIEAARADLDRTRAAVEAISATASDLVLLAPSDGRVLSRNAEPGEVIAAGRSVATLGDGRRPWVHVYLGPEHTPVIAVGDSVDAVLDAFPDRPFRGVVTSIATEAEFTPRVALTETERADMLFAVRVEFYDETETLKAGLPITVRFRPRTQATSP
jgi:HlyD family secretion protein